MATNDEYWRAGLIAEQAAFAPRVSRVFAAGPIGVRKPDAGFFDAVADQLGVAASEIVLNDGILQNVNAAQACGRGSVQSSAEMGAKALRTGLSGLVRRAL